MSAGLPPVTRAIAVGVTITLTLVGFAMMFGRDARAQRFDPLKGVEVVTAESARPGHGARGDESRGSFARFALPTPPLTSTFTHRTGSRIAVAPVVDGHGELVVASPDGTLVRIDGAGTSVSTTLFGVPQTSPLVLADGTVAVVLETEELVFVKNGRVEARSRLPAAATTAEALALLPDGTIGVATATALLRVDSRGGLRAVAPWPERARIAGQGGSWVRVGSRMYFASTAGDVVEWRLGDETTLAASIRGPFEGVAAANDRTLVGISARSTLVSLDVLTGGTRTLAASGDGRFLSRVSTTPDGRSFVTWAGNGASYVIGYDLAGKETYRAKVGTVPTAPDGGSGAAPITWVPLVIDAEGTVITLSLDGTLVALGDGGQSRSSPAGGCPANAMVGTTRLGAGNAWLAPSATTLFLVCQSGGTSGFTGAGKRAAL